MNKHKKRALALRSEAIHTYEAGKPIGDTAFLKYAAMAQPVPRGMNETLFRLRGYAPIYDPEEFSSLPEGTFGREYLNFLKVNGIQHMTYSNEVLQRFQNEPYISRIAMTHDLHHLLVGGDAGIAGETAVAAFQVGQGTLGHKGPAMRSLLRLALGYTRSRPSKTIRVWSNLWKGWRLGRKTPLLIANRLEDMFGLPIEEARFRVGLPRDPRTAGIRYTDEVNGQPLAIANDVAVNRPTPQKDP